MPVLRVKYSSNCSITGVIQMAVAGKQGLPIFLL